jgi:hypothetical protein
MHARDGIALLIAVLGAAAVFLGLAPIAQDPGYHDFADARRFLGVANFMDVTTSAAFMVVAVLGSMRIRAVERPLCTAYRTTCVAVALVSLGSAGYHLAPSNATLVWDRAPIAAGFAAVFSMVLTDRVSPRLGQLLLWPLVLTGVGTVLYWYAGELRGGGDLRAYLLVQSIPMVLIPVMLLMHPASLLEERWLWAMLVAYALAKAAEQHDAAIFARLGVLSGHSCKHLIAALAVYFALRAATSRRTGETRSCPDE